jgi:hypothetical protein
VAAALEDTLEAPIVVKVAIVVGT